MSKFNSDQAIAPQLGPAEKQQLRSPFRQPTPRSDWGTPLLQALTIAFFIAGGVGVGIIMIEPAQWFGAVKFAAMTFFILGGVLFVMLMNRSHRSIYHTLEHKPYRQPQDIRPIVMSSRGQYESPQAAPATVEDVAPEDLNQCPYPEKTMRWFVWWCDREGTGYEVWEGVLGRKRYTAWRNSLIKAGWADWNSYGANGKPNNTQGWHLKAPAELICEKVKQ